MKKILCIIALITSLHSVVSAQEMRLITSVNDQGQTLYEYLPCWVRVAIDEENLSQQLSLTSFEKDEHEEFLLHMLLTWGLDERNEKNMESSVLSRDSTGIWLGAFDTSMSKTNWGFIGDEELINLFKNALVSASDVPNYPLGKQAFSFHFKGSEAAKFNELIAQNPKKLKNLVIQYTFFFDKEVKDDFHTEANMYHLLNSIIK